MKYYILCMQNKTLLFYFILFFKKNSVLKVKDNWVHMWADGHHAFCAPGRLLPEEAHEVCVTFICHQSNRRNILNLIQRLE